MGGTQCAYSKKELTPCAASRCRYCNQDPINLAFQNNLLRGANIGDTITLLLSFQPPTTSKQPPLMALLLTRLEREKQERQEEPTRSCDNQVSDETAFLTMVTPLRCVEVARTRTRV